MTYLLYPQLPRKLSVGLAAELGTLSVEAAANRASVAHPRVTYTATGGARIQPGQLAKLAAAIRTLRQSAKSRLAFDASLARLLHSEMRLSRAEASLDGTWSFMACVLAPDVVRWRFEGSGTTPPDRFLGAQRGMRNALGRCWWRGELLNDRSPPAGRDAYWLLDELAEDELTGIMERQRAVASRRTAVALARALYGTNTRGVPRMEVARDAFKRFLRLGYFVGFETLEDEELRIACESIYLRSVDSLVKASKALPRGLLS